MKWQNFFTQETISKIWNKVKSCSLFIFRAVKSFFSFLLKRICPVYISFVITTGASQPSYERVTKFLLDYGLEENLLYYPIASLTITGIFLAVCFCIIFFSCTNIFKGITKLVEYIVEGFKTDLTDFYQEPNTNIKTLSTNPSRDYINYHDAITKIKESSYGIHAMNDAVMEGRVKETGGHTITVKSGFAAFVQGEKELYIPTSKENIEQDKRNHIYDKILQEFCKIHGYYDKYRNFTKDEKYIKDSMKIDLDIFSIFLRTKEIKIQSVTISN